MGGSLLGRHPAGPNGFGGRSHGGGVKQASLPASLAAEVSRIARDVVTFGPGDAASSRHRQVVTDP